MFTLSIRAKVRDQIDQRSNPLPFVLPLPFVSLQTPAEPVLRNQMCFTRYRYPECIFWVWYWSIGWAVELQNPLQIHSSLIETWDDKDTKCVFKTYPTEVNNCFDLRLSDRDNYDYSIFKKNRGKLERDIFLRDFLSLFEFWCWPISRLFMLPPIRLASEIYECVQWCWFMKNEAISDNRIMNIRIWIMRRAAMMKKIFSFCVHFRRSESASGMKRRILYPDNEQTMFVCESQRINQEIYFLNILNISND